MKISDFEYRAASINDINLKWDKNIENNIGDNRWVEWKTQNIDDNKAGKCKTFVVLSGDEPIGEGTLIFSSQHGAINGRTELADGVNVANINALRIEKHYEGKGYISKLVKLMEQYAKNAGYKTLTIGVEARETRNISIYLHWGYTTFIKGEIEDDALVLYYSKLLS
ncbi:MAG TPA: GNAT family N-acetyltransferase [Oscillospiraceae bacterium]|nr:GNAT family N-acetyltransferase [Oscillospiraceae bacterium]